MSSRIDDTFHIICHTDFSNHLNFPFTFQLQLGWLKNIVNEQFYLHQILLRSMYPLICVLLNIGGLGNFLGEDDDFIL